LETRYATTPIVSTYLIAFVVGELEFISGKTAEGVEVNVYTTPGKKAVRWCGVFVLRWARSCNQSALFRGCPSRPRLQ
jgi:hypothetical protein